MRKRRLKYVIAIALGFIVCVASYLYLQTSLKQEQISILVPKDDIRPYTVITTSHLEHKWLPKGSETPYMVRSDDQISIVGKVANVMLPQGVPVDKRLLQNSDDILQNKHIVSISTDYIRSAGASPGDLADVYFVNIEQQAWLLTAGQPVAKDAIVIDVTGRMGQNLNPESTSPIPLGTPPSNQNKTEPGAIRLAVNPQDAPKLVAGALPENTNFVLVVKSKQDTTPQATENYHIEEVAEIDGITSEDASEPEQ